MHTGLPVSGSAVPDKFILYGNYPNPFNPVTTISYEISRAANIQIAVYNSLGEKVQLIYQGLSPAGQHQLKWNAQQLGSGMYYIILSAGENRLIHKALLLK